MIIMTGGAEDRLILVLPLNQKAIFLVRMLIVKTFFPSPGTDELPCNIPRGHI